MHANQQCESIQSISFEKVKLSKLYKSNSDEQRYRSSVTVRPTRSHFPHEAELISKRKRVIITNHVDNYTKCKPFSFDPLDTCLDLKPLQLKKSIDSVDSLSSPHTSVRIPPSQATSTEHAADYCNELNSYLVPNANCEQTINSLKQMLSNCRQDIVSFDVNPQANCIEGLLFFSNICVNFAIFVWSVAGADVNAEQCRVEFRRISGDALPAAKLWSQIKDAFESGSELETRSIFDFIDLDVEPFEAQQEDNLSELTRLTRAMIENDLYVADELAFCLERLIKNGEDDSRVALAHGAFLKQLVIESTQNEDICVVRIALLILEQLATIRGQNMANLINSDLMYCLNRTLTHERRLIRQQTMRMLAMLCEKALPDSEWKLDNEFRAEMMQNVRTCASECGMENENVMDVISAKLMILQ